MRMRFPGRSAYRYAQPVRIFLHGRLLLVLTENMPLRVPCRAHRVAIGGLCTIGDAAARTLADRFGRAVGIINIELSWFRAENTDRPSSLRDGADRSVGEGELDFL